MQMIFIKITFLIIRIMQRTKNILYYLPPITGITPLLETIGIITQQVTQMEMGLMIMFIHISVVLLILWIIFRFMEIHSMMAVKFILMEVRQVEIKVGYGVLQEHGAAVQVLQMIHILLVI